MKPILLIAALALAGTASAQTQTPARGKPLGSWDVDYDHTSVHRHGENTQHHEHGRMTLRSVGDSLIGELVVGDSATAMHQIVRGVAAKTGWTLYAEDPPAQGFGVFFSALGAAMDWLRETVHGVAPTVVRFDVALKGDSLTGNRIVTGGLSSTPRTSAVHGVRAKP